MLTLQQKIQEAERAYHSLITGTMPRVVVDQNGERVEFTSTNRTQLYNYIQELKSQLPCSAAQRPMGPARFSF